MPKSRRAREQARQRLNRKEKRLNFLRTSEVDVAMEEYNHDTHVKPAIPVRVAKDIRISNVASTGYIGREDGSQLRTFETLQELLDDDFRLVRWDGRSASICFLYPSH
jgi:hypothetical protein